MVFKLFRNIVSIILAAFAIWMIYNGSSSLYGEISTSAGKMSPEILVTSTLSIVVGLLVVGVLYWALWTGSRFRTVLENIFSIPELIKKIAFTIALLCIYRIGFHIPLAGLDDTALAAAGKTQGVFSQALQQASMLTGGDFMKSSIFGLGIMPYISASIIFQLLVSVVPALEKLRKEGPAGSRKIQEYTRYATVGLCLVQATFWMKYLKASGYIYADYQDSFFIIIMGVAAMTAGTVFLMWLGEQIDEYGIGNGISLIIMAGIAVRMPGAFSYLAKNTDLSLVSSGGSIALPQVAFLVLAFVGVVAGAILITQGQRRIPVQQAKHTRGRRVYGGQRQYLPLRVNHGGVMPIIFASSLMIFPNAVFGFLSKQFNGKYFTDALADAFNMTSYTYSVCFILMIFFFAYFWTTVQFRPKEMADQLRDYGSFIPGIRPGKRTAEYLERVMGRITFCGAAFLALIAVIPMTVSNMLHIPFTVSSFLGGTGLLILVSVTLDLVQRIEANLVMRNYGGFLGGSTRIKGAYS